MEIDETAQPQGTNIRPIPPPLDFPFPRQSTESVRSSPTTYPTSTDSQVDASALAQLSYKTPDSHDGAVKSGPRASTVNEATSTTRPGPVAETNRLPRGTYAEGTLTSPTAGDQKRVAEAASSSSEDERQGFSKPTRAGTNRLSRYSKGSKSGPRVSSRNRASNADRYSRFSVGNDNFRTKGKVDKTSGRLDISVNETSNRGYLAKALGASLHHHLAPRHPRHDRSEPSGELAKTASEETGLRRPDLVGKVSTSLGVPTIDEFSSIPILNIVIMVIGSRGDIQPFLKVGKLLKEDYGHRVRIATHPAFKQFVEEDSGLEFFSVGGDPAELMAFMVKNPGLIPSVSTVKAGEIGRRRDAMYEMFQGFWRACVNATDDETNVSNRRMMKDKKPFVADAIIANPPSFAHVHCAEALGIPLHLMFTFPYSPTQQFPHPLANIKATNVDTNYTNFMSYPLVEMMTWQGLGDLVNRFRVRTLGLEPVSTLWAPGQLFRLRVPYTYCWSPGLVPKPSDWGPEIDIAGFVFLDLASSFEPPASLTEFLEADEAPVYIGFGSIVVDDPDQFTNLVFEAVKKAGVRALVSKGWGGLGGEDVPDNIYMLENTPHDWLFPRVSAVVHHGGAGTTAIGLKCGKPTMIVPFFGDQPFWGSMVARAGAGAHQAVPYENLSAEALAEGIKQCLSPDAKASAEAIAQSIAKEGDGAKNTVESFHRHLPLRGESSMRCTVFHDRVAVWLLKDTRLRLSALAAQIFVKTKKMQWGNLKLIRHYDWSDFEGPGEPLTGGSAAIVKTAGVFVKGIGGVPMRWAKSIRRHEKRERELDGRHITSNIVRNGEQDPGSPESCVSLPNNKANSRQGNAEGWSQGGQHGVEEYLSEPHSIGKVGSDLLANKDIVNGNIVGPVPRKTRDSNDEDVTSAAGSGDQLAQDLAEDVGTGLAKSGQALAKAPMDLSLAIAQGFHNAPRLYGDTTVRTPIRITGFHSGLRAAGQEFTLGIYDGFTGLVLQPFHGAKENGPLGFVQGIGKGVGGFVLKDLAAIFGPVGYTLKGVHKELIKKRQPTAFIRRSRVHQGLKDLEALDKQQREEAEQKVNTAWPVLQQLKNEEDIQGSSGPIGRLKVKRIKRELDSQGAFESVSRGEKVVEDRKMSRFIKESKTKNVTQDEKAPKQNNEGNEGTKKRRLVKFKGGGKSGEKNPVNKTKGGVQRPTLPQVDGSIDTVQQDGVSLVSSERPTAAGREPDAMTTATESIANSSSSTAASTMRHPPDENGRWSGRT